MEKNRKSAERRFLLTAWSQGGLMILNLLFILGCIIFPENRVLPVLAGISSIWALVAFSCAFVRFQRHLIRPCSQTEKMMQSMARGDFPPPMPQHQHEYFPELSRAVNLLRDRLQYLESSLRARQAEAQYLQREGATVPLMGRVYSRLLADLFPPLSLMGGYIELLRRNGKLSETEISAARKQFLKMLGMLQELICGMEAAASQDADKNFDLNEMLFDFNSEQQKLLQHRRIRLTSRLEANLPQILHGSRQWLNRELRALLHILAVETEENGRLELCCSGEPDAVRFVFFAPDNRTLGAEYRRSRDVDRDRPGDETPLILLELCMAVNGAGEHHAALDIREDGDGTRLILTLDHTWLDSETPRTGETGHFAESFRPQAQIIALPGTDSGRILLIAEEPETAGILQAWHPEAAWVSASPAKARPEEKFTRIIAFIPVEIAERHLQTLENELCRRNEPDVRITVIDPGKHNRFRRHLHENGIRDIHDSRLGFREFGAAGKAGE